MRNGYDQTCSFERAIIEKNKIRTILTLTFFFMYIYSSHRAFLSNTYQPVEITEENGRGVTITSVTAVNQWWNFSASLRERK